MIAKMKDFIAKFSSPDTRYRGMPFWAWNAELDEDELVRQINFFHKMGLGGFFMHARGGLNTEYLGEKWFSCIRTCIQEAEKLGMHPFLYDEDRREKITFVTLAAQLLNLHNLNAVHGRSTELNCRKEFQNKFDIVTARAVVCKVAERCNANNAF